MLDAKEVERYRGLYLNVWIDISNPKGITYARRRDTLLKVWTLTYDRWAKKPWYED